MYKKILVLTLIVVLFIINGCHGNTKVTKVAEKNENKEESKKIEEMPFKDLDSEDIKEVEMKTSVTNKFLDTKEITELVDIFKKIVVLEEVKSNDISGRGISFKIEYLDGSIVEIYNSISYIEINNSSYEVEKEIFYELGEFADKVLVLMCPAN